MVVELIKAIDRVLGVNLADLQSPSRTQDRQWGRYIYTKLCGESLYRVAKDLSKVYTTASYYSKAYDRYYETDSEFREAAEEIKRCYLRA